MQPQPDPDTPVELTSRATEAAAEVIAGSLRDRGIEARVLGGMLTGFRAEAPAQARVVVRRRDLEAARAALAEIRSASVDLDWDEVDVGAPEGPGAGPARAPERITRAAATTAIVCGASALAVLFVSMSAGLWRWASVVVALTAFLLLMAALALWFGRRSADPFDRESW
ncbi:MAG: DUF2007 domain-containing protein [Phycisphaerae bacterium]|nr:DUF2007 domain-containing protein [Phycisphaerae bacterium]